MKKTDVEMRLFVCIFVAALASFTFGVKVDEKKSEILISNEYLSATISTSDKRIYISALKGDFKGKSIYGENVLGTLGIRLERIEDNGAHKLLTSSSSSSSSSSPLYNVTRYGDDDNCAQVSFPEVFVDVSSPTVTEAWTFKLCDGDRVLDFSAQGFVLPTAVSYTLKAVTRSYYTNPLSTTGFFDKGVVQMMGAKEDVRGYFGSVDKLSRVYVVGETGALDIIRTTAVGGANDVTVLLNAHYEFSRHFRSGLQEVLVGSLSSALLDDWTGGWAESTVTQALGTRTWSHRNLLSPNDRNFPSGTLPSGKISNMDNADDVEGFMTGIYSNSVGCLCTYPGEIQAGAQAAQIATSLRQDNARQYNNTYNYFDPGIVCVYLSIFSNLWAELTLKP